jgi:hypothetical protein
LYYPVINRIHPEYKNTRTHIRKMVQISTCIRYPFRVWCLFSPLYAAQLGGGGRGPEDACPRIVAHGAGAPAIAIATGSTALPLLRTPSVDGGCGCGCGCVAVWVGTEETCEKMFRSPRCRHATVCDCGPPISDRMTRRFSRDTRSVRGARWLLFGMKIFPYFWWHVFFARSTLLDCCIVL